MSSRTSVISRGSANRLLNLSPSLSRPSMLPLATSTATLLSPKQASRLPKPTAGLSLAPSLLGLLPHLSVSHSAAIHAVDLSLSQPHPRPGTRSPSTATAVMTPMKGPPRGGDSGGGGGEPDNDLYSSLLSLQHTPSATAPTRSLDEETETETAAAAATATIPPSFDSSYSSTPDLPLPSSRQAMFVIGRPPGHHAGPNGSVPAD
jgi:hypothetical protein